MRNYKLKIIKIHEGLDHQDLRDYLSQALVDVYERQLDNIKAPFPNTGSYSDRAIQDAENNLEYYNKHLKSLKQNRAILEIISMNGWEEYDVSDYVAKEPEQRSWNNFIGNPTEYKTFIDGIQTN